MEKLTKQQAQQIWEASQKNWAKYMEDGSTSFDEWWSENHAEKPEIKLGRFGRVIEAPYETEFYMVDYDFATETFNVVLCYWGDYMKSANLHYFPTKAAAVKYKTYLKAIQKLEKSEGRKEFVAGERNWTVQHIQDNYWGFIAFASASKISVVGLYWEYVDQVEKAWNSLTSKEKQAIYDLS